MSTVGPDSITQLAAILPEDALLDAPVLGSISEAEAGTLTIFASGPPALVERWTPLLSTLGNVLPVGQLGAGTASKLVANSTLFGVLGALGEALALAQGLGLSREAAFDVLAATPLGAQAERRRPALESHRYDRRFPLSLARKDADLIVEAAEASGTELRLIPAAREWLADAEAEGRGDEDYAVALERILARART
jgi:3-hydroxyisobutyrate dehydrogenase-like beta-hydroxyacid dehydrogenase